MGASPSKGTCALCGQVFNKSGILRHLAQCGELAPGEASDQRKNMGFHLVVEGRYSKDYWLHIAVPADASLRVLDSFLRKIWLECCGHLSAFTIDGARFGSSAAAELGEASMRAPVGAVLHVGGKFFYEYDYGSTTELVLKAVGLRERPQGKPKVQLLARNNPPGIFCGSCKAGKLATGICVECSWQDNGWLCGACANRHSCDPAMLLPVVNSPRVGVCGYTG